MSRIPWRVGERYELLSQLAVSPSCAVWRGRDTVSGAECAVKVLRPELVADATGFAQLQQTLSTVSGLGHPGIAVVSETVVHEGWVALAGRFVPGRSLRALLDEQAPLPTERVMALVSQLCSALSAAHAAGVVHGNLTASQVLVDPTHTAPGAAVSGDAALGNVALGDAVLTDFGLASLINHAAGQGALPFVPVPRYRAPELRQGDPGTEASDVFGIGVILYEALAGHHPFDISGEGETVLVRRDVPEAIPGLSLPLWHLITGCLAPNPINRPPAATVARLLAGLVPTTPAARVNQGPVSRSARQADPGTDQVLPAHVRSAPATPAEPSVPSPQDSPTIFMPVIRPGSTPPAALRAGGAVDSASVSADVDVDADEKPDRRSRRRATNVRRRVVLSGVGLCAVALAAVLGLTNVTSGGPRTNTGDGVPVMAPNGGGGGRLAAGPGSPKTAVRATTSTSSSASASASASAIASASASSAATGSAPSGAAAPGESASASPSPTASSAVPPSGMGNGPSAGTALVNGRSGKCLDTQNGSYANGTAEQQLACGAATGESWALSGGALTQDGGKYCLDDYGYGNQSGSRIVLWSCNGGSNQQWTVRADGSIQNVFSKLCLDVAGQSASDGALVQLSTCTGRSSEHWSWQ
jgi:serine/threonine protein kinase